MWRTFAACWCCYPLPTLATYWALYKQLQLSMGASIFWHTVAINRNLREYKKNTRASISSQQGRRSLVSALHSDHTCSSLSLVTLSWMLHRESLGRITVWYKLNVMLSNLSMNNTDQLQTRHKMTRLSRYVHTIYNLLIKNSRKKLLL
jgi:hypothetical protein